LTQKGNFFPQKDVVTSLDFVRVESLGYDVDVIRVAVV